MKMKHTDTKFRALRAAFALISMAACTGATAVQVLDDPGIPENPGESEH